MIFTSDKLRSKMLRLALLAVIKQFSKPVSILRKHLKFVTILDLSRIINWMALIYLMRIEIKSPDGEVSPLNHVFIFMNICNSRVWWHSTKGIHLGWAFYCSSSMLMSYQSPLWIPVAICLLYSYSPAANQWQTKFSNHLSSVLHIYVLSSQQGPNIARQSFISP